MSDPRLNLETGTFTVDTMAVGPRLTRAEFLSSSLGARRRESVSNEPQHSWIVAGEVGGRTFLIVLYFIAERLEMVTLALDESGASTDWTNWSEQAELARKAEHDQWLRDVWDVNPPQQFPWGSVESVYDARGGSSEIVVNYGMGRT